MNPNKWTDQDIINGIKDNNSRNVTLYAIFHQLDWRGVAIGLLLQWGSGLQDAEEIATDSLIYLYRNVRNGRFEGRSSLKTYFIEIAKKQWWKKRGRLRPDSAPLPQYADESESSVEIIYIAEEDKKGFMEALSQIGERCKRIFELVMLEYNMEEIAKSMKFSTAEMAKKESYRCRMRFREFLQKNPVWKSRLI